MKRYSMILTAFAVMAVVSVPLFAQGPRSDQGGTYPDCPRYEKGEGYPGCPYAGLRTQNLTEAQRTQLAQFREQFAKSTAPIRSELRKKNQEMRSLMNGPKIDEAKVWELHKQTTMLRDSLDQEWLKYALKAKKVAPDARLGRAGDRGRFVGMYGLRTRGCRGYYPPDRD